MFARLARQREPKGEQNRSRVGIDSLKSGGPPQPTTRRRAEVRPGAGSFFFRLLHDFFRPRRSGFANRRENE
jgi:hypothetical protein